MSTMGTTGKTGTKSEAHSATPWTCDRGCIWGGADGQEYVAATLTGLDDEKCAANRDYIVRAANSHEALVDFAKEFGSWHANRFEDFDPETNGQLLSLANQARAALELAKGES